MHSSNHYITTHYNHEVITDFHVLQRFLDPTNQRSTHVCRCRTFIEWPPAIHNLKWPQLCDLWWISLLTDASFGLHGPVRSSRFWAWFGLRSRVHIQCPTKQMWWRCTLRFSNEALDARWGFGRESLSSLQSAPPTMLIWELWLLVMRNDARTLNSN
jgi:hypothetical protein